MSFTQCLKIKGKRASFSSQHVQKSLFSGKGKGAMTTNEFQAHNADAEVGTL